MTPKRSAVPKNTEEPEKDEVGASAKRKGGIIPRKIVREQLDAGGNEAKNKECPLPSSDLPAKRKRIASMKARALAEDYGIGSLESDDSGDEEGVKSLSPDRPAHHRGDRELCSGRDDHDYEAAAKRPRRVNKKTTASPMKTNSGSSTPLEKKVKREAAAAEPFVEEGEVMSASARCTVSPAAGAGSHADQNPVDGAIIVADESASSAIALPISEQSLNIGDARALSAIAAEDVNALSASEAAAVAAAAEAALPVPVPASSVASTHLPTQSSPADAAVRVVHLHCINTEAELVGHRAQAHSASPAVSAAEFGAGQSASDGPSTELPLQQQQQINQPVTTTRGDAALEDNALSASAAVSSLSAVVVPLSPMPQSSTIGNGDISGKDAKSPVAPAKPKNTECPICKKVVRRYDLNKHVKNVHSGDKPNKCPYCDYASPWKGNLNTHIAGVHLMTRNHECTRCKLMFKTRGAMIGHMRKVHDRMYQPKERSFECEVCHKSFFKKFHLQRHERVHTGEKPYTCPFCERRFTSKTNMDTHIQSVHLKIKPFKCGYCERGFGRKKMMLMHVRKYHLPSTRADGTLPPNTGSESEESDCEEDDGEEDELSEGEVVDCAADSTGATQPNMVFVKITENKDSNGQATGGVVKQYFLVRQEHLSALRGTITTGVNSSPAVSGTFSVADTSNTAGGSSSAVGSAGLNAIVWEQAAGGDAGILTAAQPGNVVWQVDQPEQVLQAMQTGDGNVILLAAPPPSHPANLEHATKQPTMAAMPAEAAVTTSTVDASSVMLLSSTAAFGKGTPQQYYTASQLQPTSTVSGTAVMSSDSTEPVAHGQFDMSMEMLTHQANALL